MDQDFEREGNEWSYVVYVSKAPKVLPENLISE